eukprot:6439323-Alexandrium_andersonii.AAC.1
MSASLVGSEMCIRDRYSPALDASGVPGRTARAASIRLLAMGSLRALDMACLLYTSDAADDM